MTGWVLVTFVIGVVALICAVPPMLGWSNEWLAFWLGLLMFVGAIAWLFVPLPKPVPNVDCGTVAQPKSDWTGEPFDFGSGPGGQEMISAPDFHRQCSDNRSSAVQQAVLLALGGAGVMIVYGSKARKKLHGTQSSG